MLMEMWFIGSFLSCFFLVIMIVLESRHVTFSTIGNHLNIIYIYIYGNVF